MPFRLELGKIKYEESTDVFFLGKEEDFWKEKYIPYGILVALGTILKNCLLTCFLSYIASVSCRVWLSSKSSNWDRAFAGVISVGWPEWITVGEKGYLIAVRDIYAAMWHGAIFAINVFFSFSHFRSKHWSWILTFTELDRVKCFSELESLLILKKKEI